MHNINLSGGSGGDTSNEFGKELEPFPFDDDHEPNRTGSADSPGSGCLEDELGLALAGVNGDCELPVESSVVGGGGWCAEDMLLTNETKYGYKSTYNSDLPEYTVAIEKKDSDEYRRREEEAEKIAAEIESCSTYRNNIDKELSDNEEEEEAFSAVVRAEINNNINTPNNNNNNNNNNNSSSSNVKEFHSSKSEKFMTMNNRRSFNNKPMMPRTLSGGSVSNSSQGPGGYHKQNRYPTPIQSTSSKSSMTNPAHNSNSLSYSNSRRKCLWENMRFTCRMIYSGCLSCPYLESYLLSLDLIKGTRCERFIWSFKLKIVSEREFPISD